jgi:hypothetical protein
MALSPDLELKVLRDQAQLGLRLWSMVLNDADLVFVWWWLLRLDNACRQEVPSTSRCNLATDALPFRRWPGILAIGGSGEDGALEDLFVFSAFLRGLFVVG